MGRENETRFSFYPESPRDINMEVRTPRYLKYKFLAKFPKLRQLTLSDRIFHGMKTGYFSSILSVATDLLGTHFCISQSTCQFLVDSQTQISWHRNTSFFRMEQSPEVLPEFLRKMRTERFFLQGYGHVEEGKGCALGQGGWNACGMQKNLLQQHPQLPFPALLPSLPPQPSSLCNNSWPSM